MAKGYWVVAYRKINDPAQLAEYGKLAVQVIASHSGTVLIRGTAAKAYEDGLAERVVLVEFDSVATAITAYESDAYAKALEVLGTAAERDFRILEGA